MPNCRIVCLSLILIAGCTPGSALNNQPSDVTSPDAQQPGAGTPATGPADPGPMDPNTGAGLGGGSPGTEPNCVALPTPTLATTLAVAVIDPNNPNGTIPPSFLGMSHEWLPFAHLAKTLDVHPSYLQLLNNLTQYRTGPFIIRVGGASQDNFSGRSKTILSSDPNVIVQLAQIHAQAKTLFIYGLDLFDDYPTMKGSEPVSAPQVRAALAALPAASIVSFELGNEPNFYPNYSYNTYLTEYSHIASLITPLLGGGHLAGPAIYGSLSGDSLDAFIQDNGALNLLTFHHYENGARSVPADLLAESHAVSGFQQIADDIGDAHRKNRAIRYGEYNSFAKGGVSGVSNTLAAAFWTLDNALELARAGLDGVHFHNFPDGFYSAINEVEDASGNLLPVVRPPYYGYLLFQQFAESGAGFLPVALTTTANVKAWAVKTPANAINVLIINKDTAASGKVVLKGLPPNATTRLTRLTGPSIGSIAGLTLAGQTFDNTPDGKPVGPFSCYAVGPDAAGSYTVALNVGEAVLLQLH